MPPELEAKLIAPDELRLPDLNGLVKGATAVQRPTRHLEAVYFDTPDLRLARNGITLRYRTGEDGPPWTVKLPEGSSHAALRRREVSFDRVPGTVPPQAADLVRAYARSRPLVPVARLHTDRTPIEIRGPDGGPLAEIADDRVTVYDEHGLRTGGFREVEAEVRADGLAGGRLLRAAVGRLKAAGCWAEPPIPKVIRALGPRASGPPDVVVPSVVADATVGELIRYATARSVAQMLRPGQHRRAAADRRRAARPCRAACRCCGRRPDPPTLATAETGRPGPQKGLARHPMARRPHPGQAVPLCRRSGRTGLRPPGRPVRGSHRRGPGHPRRSSRHRGGRGMAPRHRRRCFSGMHRRRRTDHGGATGTGHTPLKVAEGVETRKGQEAATLAVKTLALIRARGTAAVVRAFPALRRRGSCPAAGPGIWGGAAARRRSIR